MSQVEKNIYVYESWCSDAPSLIGILHASFVRGAEIFSFEYSPEWLSSFQSAYPLDPDLTLYRGRQYAPLDKKMFGLFADSCPDRWGRLLMQRKEAIEARKKERRPRKLTDSDFLLGVYDEYRMGALRFSLEEGGEFVSNEETYSIPPWVSLRVLEHASTAFENDDGELDERLLHELLAPGSSLGGARPKATVIASDGALWIAKFPSKHDESNTGAWEKTVHELARSSGLNVPESKLETFSQNGSTFLVKRFDRAGKRRIHFASAMTLLGKTDGASGADGTSYLDIASFIRANGAEPKNDLKELWKRIVFNMSVSNTDDHLRNHGFLLTQTGWKLSPLFDVNPTPYGERLSLNITELDNTINLKLALEISEYFELSKIEAEINAAEVIKTVQKNWISFAERFGLSRGAIEYMRPAFSLKL